MFKKKYQIEVNEKEYNIIVNTLNEYRNKQLLKQKKISLIHEKQYTK